MVNHVYLDKAVHRSPWAMKISFSLKQGTSFQRCECITPDLSRQQLFLDETAYSVIRFVMRRHIIYLNCERFGISMLIEMILTPIELYPIEQFDMFPYCSTFDLHLFFNKEDIHTEYNIAIFFVKVGQLRRYDSSQRSRSAEF